MKHKEMTETIEDEFKVINKLLYKILKEFNTNDIHDLRVEVKKLRAFLRMAHVYDEDEKAVIPKLLKTFYGYIGIMRNIQLQKHRLFEYITNCKADKPHEYINVLDKEKDYWQDDAVALMKDNNFDQVKEKIIRQLPGKIDNRQIKKFVQTKLDALTTSINNLQDEVQVHTTRKILKDILYTWNHLNNKSVLPEAISNEEKLKSMTGILGNFRDICVELEFMEPEYLHKIQDENEKIFLWSFYNILQLEKKRITRKVLDGLNVLQHELCHAQIILN